MVKARSRDYNEAMVLLRAALGEFDAKKPLGKLIARVPDFGKFEWMLTIIGLEIDLRVDIPESLADNLNRTAERFALLVADLPKVDSPGYTLECLSLVAQALLSIDLSTPASKKKARKRPSVETTGHVRTQAKTPRKQTTSAKRTTRTDR